MTQKQKKLAAEIRKGLKFLAKLGSKEAIAAYFERMGIRGTRFNACGCPVSRFLSVHTLHTENIAVCQTSCSTNSFRMEINGVVTNFIAAFDSREFPTLEVAA